MKTTIVTVITGTLFKDAELSYTANGTGIVKFSLPYETGWGDNKETIWANVSWFGAQAEKRAEKMTRGTELTVMAQGAEIPKNNPKNNALYYNASNVIIGKYGEQGFKDDVSSFTSDFDDEVDIF